MILHKLYCLIDETYYLRFARRSLFGVIYKQVLSLFWGECIKGGGGVIVNMYPPPIVTPPRASGTGERRELEWRAWSSLFVCVGSFSELLNSLSQIEVRR